MKRFLKILIMFVFLSDLLFAQINKNDNLNKMYDGNSLAQGFIENLGQWEPSVKFLARLADVDVWITDEGVFYNYYTVSKSNSDSMNDEFIKSNSSINGQIIKMSLTDKNGFCQINENSEIVGYLKQRTYHSYFIGSDETKWKSMVPIYNEVLITNVYPGVTVRFYFEGSFIRYDFINKNGADISQINIKFEGQDDLYLDSSGNLTLETFLGKISHQKLFAYQKINENTVAVPCSFKIMNNQVNFTLDKYDLAYDLIIDPLIFSTSINAVDKNTIVYDMLIDKNENIIITGITESPNYFSKTTGKYSNLNGNDDIFLTKINSGGTNIEFSIFLGGLGEDRAMSLAADQYNNYFLAGNTYSDSKSFPLIGNQFSADTKYSRSFFMKIDEEGLNILFSSFIGGQYDIVHRINVDSENNVVLGGETTGKIPLKNSYQSKLGGHVDCFITKINSTLEDIIFSTFLGGTGDDICTNLTFDDNNDIYLTGYTSSKTDFPTIGNPFSKINRSTTSTTTDDIFVSHFTNNGNLVYSTYIGGDGNDMGFDIELDNQRNIYVVGTSNAANFPCFNAFSSVHPGFNQYDGVFIKFNETEGEGRLSFSSFLGGNSNTIITDLQLDSRNNIYFFGSTTGNKLQSTNPEYDQNLNKTNDYFFGIINVDLKGINYLSRIGGDIDLFSTFPNGDYRGEMGGLFLNNSNEVYISNVIRNNSLNTTISLDGNLTTKNNNYRPFVAKFDLSGIKIMQPNFSDLIYPERSYPIKWIIQGIDKVNIEYSTDGGQNWEIIILQTDATVSQYNWFVPFTPSENCIIRICSSSNNSVCAISGIFEILDVVEIPFKPEEDGFNFQNATNYIWPQNWWSSNCSNQPASELTYLLPQDKMFKCSDFPDWNLFSNVYTRDLCGIPGNLKTKAVKYWGALKGPWAGSCFGFTYQALIYFSSLENLPNGKNQTNEIVLPENSKNSELIRNKINSNQIKQYSIDLIRNRGKNIRYYYNNFNQLKKDLIKSFKSNRSELMGLAFWYTVYSNSDNNAHSVLPYRIVKGRNSNQEILDTIYVYDNNHPNSNNVYFLFNWSKNSLSYNGNTDIKSINSFILDVPCSQVNNFEPNFNAVLKNERDIILSKQDNSNSITMLSNNGYKITDQYGKIAVPSDPFNIKIDSCYPIIPLTGGSTEVLGFLIDDLKGKNIKFDFLTSNKDSCSFILLKDSIHFHTSFLGKPGNSIHYFYDNDSMNIQCSNNNTINDLKFQLVKNGSDDDKIVEFNFSQIKSNEKISLKPIKGSNEYSIKNIGISKKAKINFSQSSKPNSDLEFSNVNFNKDTYHVLNVKNWNNISKDSITISYFSKDNKIPDSTVCLNCQKTDVPLIQDNLCNLEIQSVNSQLLLELDCSNQYIKKVQMYDLLGSEIPLNVNELDFSNPVLINLNQLQLLGHIYIVKVTLTNNQIISKIILK